MTNATTNLLKYANLQMAAEALFEFNPILGSNAQPGKSSAYPEILERYLTAGNTRSSRFTATEATDFAAKYSVVEHISNTSTGFSGTQFRDKTTNELVMSLRSTEFNDDAARDNEATNAQEIRPFGWAFGQISDMQKWYAKLKADPAKLGNSSFSVTGYSLGGHLATTCASRWHAVAKCIKLSIRYRNNSCLRNIYQFYSPKT